jgi:NTP-dependent ternary system trypsin peptidase co-occuring protein
MDGIDLADAIEMLRAQLLVAQEKATRADAQFPIQSLTVTLKIGATTSVDGKAGFKVPFVEVGASGGLREENAQTVTLVLGPPVNRQGVPIMVGQASSRRKK